MNENVRKSRWRTWVWTWVFCAIMAMLFAVCIAVIAVRECQGNNIDEARALARTGDPIIDRATGILGTRYRFADMMEGGHWHFFTIKEYANKTLVVISYQPERGSLLILRWEVDPYSEVEVASLLILQEHYHIIWSLYPGTTGVDAMIGEMLRLIRTGLSPPFSFTPSGDMRDDLCWEVKRESPFKE